MPRNGSGTFNFLTNTAYPAVDGVTLLSADWNAFQADIAAALTGSVASDGQTPLTGNLNMGNNRITNQAAASAVTDSANAADVQGGSWQWLTGVAGADTITASLTGFTVYATKQTFRFVVDATNTGAVTLNINAVGAKAITKNGATALVAGDLLIGAVVEIAYDGTQFQVITPSESATGAAVRVGTPATAKTALEVSGVGTAVNLSGTSIDFLSIPSWAKQITLPIAGLSLSGTDNPVFQLGDSGGVENAGYLGCGAALPNAGATTVTNYANGFGIPSANSANVLHGSITFTLLNPATNLWVASGSFSLGVGATNYTVSGTKALSAPLDRIRITSFAGANTLDAGSANIFYVG